MYVQSKVSHLFEPASSQQRVSFLVLRTEYWFDFEMLHATSFTATFAPFRPFPSTPVQMMISSLEAVCIGDALKVIESACT